MSDKNICPSCGKEGQKVKNFTVRRFVQKPYQDSVKDKDFYLCLNSTCEVGYFNNTLKNTIHRGELKKPLWFKHDADPKIIEKNYNCQ